MYKCDICGREMNKKQRCEGYILCKKHLHQLKKYHGFLDDNPRDSRDMNEFRYLGKEIIEMDVYDNKFEKVASFIFDSEDLARVQYHKWRKNRNGDIITGTKTNKNPKRLFSRFILEVGDDEYVEHINGNSLDLRKKNLRIVPWKEESLDD